MASKAIKEEVKTMHTALVKCGVCGRETWVGLGMAHKIGCPEM